MAHHRPEVRNDLARPPAAAASTASAGRADRGLAHGALLLSSRPHHRPEVGRAGLWPTRGVLLLELQAPPRPEAHLDLARPRTAAELAAAANLLAQGWPTAGSLVALPCWSAALRFRPRAGRPLSRPRRSLAGAPGSASAPRP
eukprot:tig00000171_g10956.t1